MDSPTGCRRLLIKRGIADHQQPATTRSSSPSPPRSDRCWPLPSPTSSSANGRSSRAAFGIAVSGILFGQMTRPRLLIFFGMLLTLSNNILSFSFHAYQAELYPTRIRALAVGFVYSWSRISVVFSSFVIGFFLDRFGVPGVFTLIAGSMLIVMLAIGLLGPRTNNLALEAISN